MLVIILFFVLIPALACAAIFTNVQKRKLANSLKPVMVAAVFIALAFTGCCDRKSIVDGKFSNPELQTILTKNKTYFDSIYKPTIHASDTSSINYGQPITLKDTACIMFSAGPMSQNGALINEWQITFGASGQYTCYIGITTSSVPQVTQSNGKVFDLRYTFSLTGFPAIEGTGAGTEVSVSPWNSTGTAH